MIRSGALLITCFVLCLGCASKPPARVVSKPPPPSCPVPGAVALELEASDRVNPDENGRSLPTRIRLYQLTDLSRLHSSAFEDMWSNAKATLADTRVSDEEVVIYPGQVTVHRFKRDPNADYVVAVAIFREPQGDAWRTTQEWPAGGDPCRATGMKYPSLDKLRMRMFLEDSRIEFVSNFGELPKHRCPPGSPTCAENPALAPELRRHHHLRTFEEDPREREPEREPERGSERHPHDRR